MVAGVVGDALVGYGGHDVAEVVAELVLLAADGIVSGNGTIYPNPDIGLP